MSVLTTETHRGRFCWTIVCLESFNFPISVTNAMCVIKFQTVSHVIIFGINCYLNRWNKILEMDELNFHMLKSYLHFWQLEKSVRPFLLCESSCLSNERNIIRLKHLNVFNRCEIIENNVGILQIPISIWRNLKYITNDI